jgi:hypothetical protein
LNGPKIAGTICPMVKGKAVFGFFGNFNRWYLTRGQKLKRGRSYLTKNGKVFPRKKVGWLKSPGPAKPFCSENGLAGTKTRNLGLSPGFNHWL